MNDQVVPAPIARYLDAYNARDVDAMLACVTDDVLFENVSNTGGTVMLRGRGSFADAARRTAEVFAERRQTVRTCVASGTRVAIEVDYEGVIAMDLPNGLGEGDHVELRAVSFFDLRDGLIARITDFS